MMTGLSQDQFSLSFGKMDQNNEFLEQLAIFQKLRQSLQNNHSLLVMYLDVTPLYDIEYQYGTSYYAQALETVNNILKEEVLQEIQPQLSFIEKSQLLGDDLVVFCALERPLSSHELYDIDLKLRVRIHRGLEEGFSMLPHKFLQVRVGHYLLGQESRDNLSQAIFSALKYALKNAKSQEKSLTSSLFAQFEQLLAEENINHVYQPIVSLKQGFTLGWEALARGPQDSYFHSPAVLFPYAEEIGSLLQLEQISQKKALFNISPMQSQQRIFLNVTSHIASSLDSLKNDYLHILEDKGLTSSNVVFELTERTSINDFQNFRKALVQLRKKGFAIAVDDAGAGYSSLQAIAELQPNFIKLDMSIIRNINNDPVKKALVETFVTFAKKINSSLIGEGIETKEELQTLIKLGVDFGQGYYLGRPAYPSPEINPAMVSYIKKLNQKSSQSKEPQTATIGQIAKEIPTVHPHMPVKAVIQLFAKNSRLEGLVVANEMAPLGLVMRHSLSTLLSTDHNLNQWYLKPITTVMDANPLIVEENFTLEKVSHLATSREQGSLYDQILVTKHGLLLGSVSIKQLLEVITESNLHLAMARPKKINS